MPQIPTPKRYHGAVEILGDRCSVLGCEYWHVTECAAVEIPSLVLDEPGANYGKYVPLAAAGGRPQDCLSTPFFSRVNVCIPFIKPTSRVGAPTDSVPGKVHLEARVGNEGIVSRVARVVWTPNSWGDFGDLFQLSGLLVNRVEIWGWMEFFGTDPGIELPALIKLNLLIDREGDGDVSVFVNSLANVATDTT